MELFLNLAWLLLALPAFWLWRESRTALTRGQVSSFHCLLAVSCMLVILFPVVSATDDLHAMRAEMEESPASKRSVHQSASDRSSIAKWQSQPSLVWAPLLFVPADRSWLEAPLEPPSPSPLPAQARTSRAPPRSVLG
jgi:hypothetical protein